MKAKKIMLTAAVISVFAATALTGCSKESKKEDNKVESAASSYKDGEYTKTAAEADNGYTYTVTMTVADGKITAMDWDAADADGNSKKQQAMDGTYDMMNGDAPNWAEQSELACQYVIDHQSLDGIKFDENGKTDAVASVSISVSSFVELASDCIEQAQAK